MVIGFLCFLALYEENTELPCHKTYAGAEFLHEATFQMPFAEIEIWSK